LEVFEDPCGHQPKSFAPFAFCQDDGSVSNKRQKIDNGDAGAADDSSPGASGSSDPNTPRPEPKAKAKAKGKAKPKGKAKAKAKAKSPEAAFKATCSKWMLLGTSANTLINLIERDDRYQWARNDSILGDLKAKDLAIREEVPPLLDIMVAEGWKAVTDRNTCHSEFVEVSDAMDEKLLELESLINNVKKMHSNRPGQQDE
jgi:hypothetical protein